MLIFEAMLYCEFLKGETPTERIQKNSAPPSSDEGGFNCLLTGRIVILDCLQLKFQFHVSSG